MVVNAYSKWPQAVIMPSISSTIDVLRQIFSMFGVPEHIVSDNGAQFTSEEFATFMTVNGIKHSLSAPCIPSTNGLAERFVHAVFEARTQGQFVILTISHILTEQFHDDLSELSSLHCHFFS